MSKFKVLALLLIILVGLAYFYRAPLLVFYQELLKRLPFLNEQAAGLLEKIEKEISTPSPLRAERDAETSNLTEVGIIELTNQQRLELGLSPLLRSVKLDVAALLKATDMLAGQYFEHVSPSGTTVNDLVDQVNYEFIAIGENLALGNFKDDESLVQAWLASPGHRANILNPKYQEIGVSVIHGQFEGKSTWLAVQEFGRPLTSCPSVREDLLIQIKSKEVELNSFQSQIESKNQELKEYRGNRQAYNEKVKEYNVLINQYNDLAEEYKSMTAVYNSSIEAFNQCLRSP